MSSFTSPLHVKDLGRTDRRGRATFEVTEPFTFEIGAVGSGLAITVPAGYVTNYASVPRAFLWVLPVNGRHGKAAVVHDYLCNERFFQDKEGKQFESGFSRWMADCVFYEAMTVLGVPWWRRKLAWLGVRLYANLARRK